VLSLGVVAPRAEDLGAVKARMSQRLSKLDAFKTQGAVGENNHGMLELRGGGPEAGDVVAGENHDREIVYAAIAQQTGSSADAVGRARAKQIAAGSAAGVWLQRDTGEWYKK
jgi:uncharacterized protein YdbL (DUF1318 family)